MATLTLERTLTELDHRRLTNLQARRRRAGDRFAHDPTPTEAIDDLLDACTLVPPREVPPDVVTMYSQLLLRELDTGAQRKIAVSYPDDAEPAAGFVSVLSPLGSALLGLRVGSVARWTTPSGEERAAEIVAVLFQPEDSGDYAL